MRQSETVFSMFVLAAAVLWGTTGTAQSFAPANASPLSVGAVRLAVGGAALLIFAGLSGEMTNKTLWSKRNAYLAAGCLSAYQLCFFAAVLRTGVAIGTVIGVGSAPVFAGLISIIFCKENPGWKWTVATLLSIIGCVLMLTGGRSVEMDSLGVVLAFGAGISYAMYTAISKELLKEYSPKSVTGVVFFLGALLLSPVLIVSDLSWLSSVRGIGVAIHLGVIATALAYVLFSYGLAKISFPKAVTLSLAEPMTAAALGMFLLKEQLSLISRGGMVLVFAGLIFASFAEIHRADRAQA